MQIINLPKSHDLTKKHYVFSHPIFHSTQLYIGIIFRKRSSEKNSINNCHIYPKKCHNLHTAAKNANINKFIIFFFCFGFLCVFKFASLFWWIFLNWIIKLLRLYTNVKGVARLQNCFEKISGIKSNIHKYIWLWRNMVIKKHSGILLGVFCGGYVGFWLVLIKGNIASLLAEFGEKCIWSVLRFMTLLIPLKYRPTQDI